MSTILSQSNTAGHGSDLLNAIASASNLQRLSDSLMPDPRHANADSNPGQHSSNPALRGLLSISQFNREIAPSSLFKSYTPTSSSLHSKVTFPAAELGTPATKAQKYDPLVLFPQFPSGASYLSFSQPQSQPQQLFNFSPDPSANVTPAASTMTTNGNPPSYRALPVSLSSYGQTHHSTSSAAQNSLSLDPSMLEKTSASLASLVLPAALSSDSSGGGSGASAPTTLNLSPFTGAPSFLPSPQDFRNMMEANIPIAALNVASNAGTAPPMMQASSTHRRSASVNAGSRHRCTMCGEAFNTRFSLKRHQKKHSGARPYVCDHPDCGKTFAERSTLKRHVRVHTGERPFKCPFASCGKTFADRTNVKRHELSHTGTRPFKCNYCRRDFLRRNHLTAHVATAHPQQHLQNSQREQQFRLAQLAAVNHPVSSMIPAINPATSSVATNTNMLARGIKSEPGHLPSATSANVLSAYVAQPFSLSIPTSAMTASSAGVSNAIPFSNASGAPRLSPSLLFSPGPSSSQSPMQLSNASQTQMQYNQDFLGSVLSSLGQIPPGNVPGQSPLPSPLSPSASNINLP